MGKVGLLMGYKLFRFQVQYALPLNPTISYDL